MLCYEHHVVTNNIHEYPVSKLKKIKKDHEDKYSGVIQKMQNSVVDYGISTSFSESIACLSLSDVMGYGCSYDMNVVNSQILNNLLNKIIDLPIETRFLLSIMVSRSFTGIQDNCIVPLHEIEAATGKNTSYLFQHIDILKRRKLISEPAFDEYNCPFSILYNDPETGWNYWCEIREFCKKKEIPTKEIFVELNFRLFD